MSRFRILLCIFLMVLLMSGCSILSDGDKIMQIEDYDMQVTLPSNWVKVTKENPYDLYCFNGNGYLGIFVYHEVDLLENQTPELIYENQIEDLFLQSLQALILWTTIMRRFMSILKTFT